MLKGKPHSDVSGSRFALGVAGLVLVTLLGALPLGISAQTTPRSRLEESSGAAADASATEPIEAESASAETIRGYMTLEDVAQQTGVPVADSLERLDLPRDTEPTEKIGRLLRSHGLEYAGPEASCASGPVSVINIRGKHKPLVSGTTDR